MKINQLDSDTESKHFLDSFPSGALVTDASKTITYVNSYFTSELLWKPGELIGKSADDIFTQSSQIFFQSYLVPMLLHEKICQEMQLIIFNAKGQRIPITVNASAVMMAVFTGVFSIHLNEINFTMS